MTVRFIVFLVVFVIFLEIFFWFTAPFWMALLLYTASNTQFLITLTLLNLLFIIIYTIKYSAVEDEEDE